jgi:hypothetical protein
MRSLLIRSSLYNANRHVYNKKDLPSDAMVARQIPFFAMFGARAGSETRAPFTSLDDTTRPASLHRAFPQERAASAANFAGRCLGAYGSIKFGASAFA